ncbi:HAMP domain-containing sensor histidine kinase [Paraflavisolibacter sp. H34]|uniref:HAMP domain-containing sensor histidine kinase n=1 Tax=Huijunlia imazamoxiresistens TaxID=3127457 RepID=UPI003015D1ED
MMENINSNLVPFKVSARTARLIGRENIATSKGAIIELVKNGYDADSKICIVYFDNKYSLFLNEVEQDYIDDLLSKNIKPELLNEIYEKKDESYIARPNITEDRKVSFKNEISKLSTLYIIDFGEGMTQKIIRDHWMTIGTDNKANEVFTKSGRVKAGAKGIGRFALDKLGSKCEMTTIFNPDYHFDTDLEGNSTEYTGYHWAVNWEDFEGEFKTIDKVGAILTGIKTSYLKEELLIRIPQIDLTKIESEKDFKYGTILKISDLRDNWEDYFVDQVYSDLEVLVPPKETGGFEIFVFSSLMREKYGEVLGSVCDDFDYKLTAVADENQNVKIKIYRNEYDLELIPNDFFSREAMQKKNYTKADFLNGYWEKQTTFSQLLQGFRAVDEDKTFDNIGVFDFTFYFLKRQTNSLDSKKFFNKNFLSNARRDWLNKFGGIKLFRDNFRVRPYGEVKDTAFDWLGLGNRKSASPAGIGKKEGGYKVEPENVAGAIRISRLTNVNFEDKSSREGLQENKTFQVFKNLIAEVIAEFEEDRSYIAREMSAYDDLKYGPERDRRKAEELKQRILTESRARRAAQRPQSKNDGNNNNQEQYTETDTEKEILASEIERKEEEIEKLKEEQKVLRGLASSGIVLASFSHDLSKLNDVLASRTDKLKKLIIDRIKESDYADVEDRKNPFKQLERIKKQDIKLQNWLNFSLGATRKDKRRRKQLYLKPYFTTFKNDWNTVFENRGITMDISEIEELDMRVFEIDIDSIFNNLLVNSIDAFIISKETRERIVTIKVSSNAKDITFDYYDNGPGLSSDIVEPERIFEPLYTTKRNAHTGEEEGTGLGMWLVKSIVEENNGKIKLLFPKIGFGLRISFPIKYKSQLHV